MLRASIDIGSNSCLLLIGQYCEARPGERGTFSTHCELAEITGLARGLDQRGEFSSEAMADTFRALRMFGEECGRHNIAPDQVLVTATEASRVATNAGAFLQQVAQELGLAVRILSAGGEAYYAAWGVFLGGQWPQEQLVLIDIGGASTELIKIATHPFKVVSSVSLPVGAVRLSEWICAGDDQQKLDRIWHDFAPLTSYQGELAVGLSGSAVSQGAIYLGANSYQAAEICGLQIPLAHYQAFGEELRRRSQSDLRREFPFLGKRIPYIHAGALLLQSLAERLEVERIGISTYGLRHGTLAAGSVAKSHCFSPVKGSS